MPITDLLLKKTYVESRIERGTPLHKKILTRECSKAALKI